jgi:hypothetical protein
MVGGGWFENPLFNIAVLQVDKFNGGFFPRLYNEW